MVFEKRIRLYRGLMKVLRFVLWSNVRGPIIPAVLITEKIYPIIAVENFNTVAKRKCFFALDAFKFHFS